MYIVCKSFSSRFRRRNDRNVTETARADSRDDRRNSRIILPPAREFFLILFSMLEITKHFKFTSLLNIYLFI